MKRKVQLLMSLAIVILLPVVSAAVEVGKKAPAGGTGTITGVVKFAGTPPPPVKFPVSTDITRCGTERWSKGLIIGLDRGVQHAVITLVGIQAPPQEAHDGPRARPGGLRVHTPRRDRAGRLTHYHPEY